jgi:hypothetical protein
LLGERSEPQLARRAVEHRLLQRLAAKPCAASASASSAGAPVGHDQPSLPISMRNEGRVARQSPEREFSTPDVDSGPRYGHTGASVSAYESWIG